MVAFIAKCILCNRVIKIANIRVSIVSGNLFVKIEYRVNCTEIESNYDRLLMSGFRNNLTNHKTQ